MRDGIILILLVVILLMVLIGRDHRGPAAIIQDVSARVTTADWQACSPDRGAPLTAPPPGKRRTDYRTRDGGMA